MLIHAAGAVGVGWIIVHPSVPTVALAASLYVACGHRLFAHRTYRPAAAVRWAMLAFGAATFQNSALSWSADHRAHHADTDGSGDPHPVTRGAWFADIGWLFRRRQASADVTLLTDLWAVRSIRLQHRYYPAVALGSDSSCHRSSPHSGATRGAGCSSPGSSVPPSSCRRRSA